MTVTASLTFYIIQRVLFVVLLGLAIWTVTVWIPMWWIRWKVGRDIRRGTYDPDD